MTNEETIKFYQEEIERLEYMKQEQEYKLKQGKERLEAIEHNLKSYQDLLERVLP